MRRLLAPVFALLVSACSVGPEYVRPEVPLTPAYKHDPALWKRAQPSDVLPRGPWWEIFGDAKLDELARRVDISNQTIRAAEARVRQARAISRQARAGLFPDLSARGSASRNRASGSGTSSSYAIGVEAAWEPDLWGRVRRSVEAGDAQSQASVADLEAARLSVLAELAQNYFALRVIDAQSALLERTVAAYGRSLALTNSRYAAGVAAKADVVQAEVQLKSAQVALVDTGLQRAQLENAIALLVGEPPAGFSLARGALVAAPPRVPAGVPSELLERRPDIASAERRVAAANAQIGVAEAAFYPSLPLSASVATRASSLADLLGTPTRLWGIGAAIAQLLFDGGARQAVADQARAAYDAQVAVYRQTVLNGFGEVEDNLAALRILEDEAGLQDELVRAARVSVDLANKRYQAGVANFLEVITAQTIALGSERAALGILARRLAASVSLVRALGGGWSDESLERAPRQ